MFYLPNRAPFALEELPGRVISIVGAGGKSTILYFLARHHAARGKRVLVLTTTKIWHPDPGFFASTVRGAQALWDQRKFAVIGTPIPSLGKLAFPEEGLFRRLLAKADLVLVEADGARHHPIKFPRPGEPVLLPQTDTVLCVMGLTALGQPVGSCCFGWGNPEDKTPLNDLLAAQILREGYSDGDFYILNQWDHPGVEGKLPEYLPKRVLLSRFSPSEQRIYEKIARGSMHAGR